MTNKTPRILLAVAVTTAALGAHLFSQAPAISVAFSADRNPIPATAVSVLTWSAEGATSCTASGHTSWTGSKPASGTFEFTVARDVTLMLECRNGARTGTASLALTTLKTTFSLPSSTPHWMSIPVDVNADGFEEIVMTTMDQRGISEVTPPTPIYVLGARDSVVTDMTGTLFPSGAPLVYSGKMVSGDFDGDGTVDLMSCDRGRSPGTQPPVDALGTVPIWRGKNQVFLQRNGRFVDVTAGYPDTIACHWGCSASTVDGPRGPASMVISSFGLAPGFSQAYLLRWNGSKFDLTKYLAAKGVFDNWGWSAGGDFNGDGFGDVVGLRRVMWGGPQYQDGTVSASKVEQAGYTFMRGSLVADFTGDGIQDLVRTSGLEAPTLAGARFALYAGARGNSLAEKLDAFPDVGTYNLSDFGNELNALDVNFDGFLDIAEFGTVYTFGSVQRAPTSVWLNDGTGRFSQAHWSDPMQSVAGNCALYQAYFLKTPDPRAFNLVLGSCSHDYLTRTVTPEFPLTFTR